jgi:hypothetical protein
MSECISFGLKSHGRSGRQLHRVDVREQLPCLRKEHDFEVACHRDAFRSKRAAH